MKQRPDSDCSKAQQAGLSVNVCAAHPERLSRLHLHLDGLGIDDSLLWRRDKRGRLGCPSPRFLGISSPVSSEREQKGPGVLTLQERKPGTQRDKGRLALSRAPAGGARATEGGPGRVLVDGSCGRGANKLTCLCCLPGAHQRDLSLSTALFKAFRVPPCCLRGRRRDFSQGGGPSRPGSGFRLWPRLSSP